MNTLCKKIKEFAAIVSVSIAMLAFLCVPGIIVVNLIVERSKTLSSEDCDKAKSHLTAFNDLEFEDDYGEFSNLMNESKNIDFVYTYGAISDENADRLRDELFSTYMDFPASFEAYIKEGGIIVIADTWDKFSKMSKDLFFNKIQNEENSHTSGYILYDDNNEIPNIICICYNRITEDVVGDESQNIENSIIEFFNQNTTLKHEFAHYIDLTYKCSDTYEFNNYFKEYAEDYEPRGSTSENYQLKNEKEFFAILVADIMGYTDSVLEIPEDLYDYMYNCLYESDGITKETL